MMKPVIKVEQLGKRYRIGARETHTSLRDAIVARFQARFANPDHDGAQETIWALRDESGDDTLAERHKRPGLIAPVL